GPEDRQVIGMGDEGGARRVEDVVVSIQRHLIQCGHELDDLPGAAREPSLPQAAPEAQQVALDRGCVDLLRLLLAGVALAVLAMWLACVWHRGRSRQAAGRYRRSPCRHPPGT